MLIRITPQIILVRPEGKTLYPYSNSLYINDNIKTIIDAGAGGNAYQEIAPDHIELLLLSHYHFDHINGWPFFLELLYILVRKKHWYTPVRKNTLPIPGVSAGGTDGTRQDGKTAITSGFSG